MAMPLSMSPEIRIQRFVVKECYIIHANLARFLDHIRSMGTMGYSKQLKPRQYISSTPLLSADWALSFPVP